MKTIESKALAVIEKKSPDLIDKANVIIVKDKDTMKVSGEYLSQCNIWLDSLKKEKEDLITPFKDGIKNIESRFNPTEKILKGAILHLRDQQSSYQTEQVRIAREEEAKIANRIGEGKGKLKLDTAAKKVAEIDKPDTEIVTDSGSVKFREDQTFEVTDVSLLPAEYILPNEVKIRAAMKAGIKLPGVKYGTKMTPINSR